jgi:hypothetical protein
MSDRIVTQVLSSANVLGSTQALSGVVPVEIRGDGLFSFHIQIDNGAGGASTDSPVGAWEIWTSADGVLYENSTGVTIDPDISASGDYAYSFNLRFPVSSHLSSAWTFKPNALPGRFFKFRYVRTSGGGGDSRATVTVVTW